jgi:hypothetical protein
MGKENGFQKLGEENYNIWCVYMKALLTQKDVWDIVDGSETRPPSSDSSKIICAFVKKQQLMQSELTLAIEPEQLPYLHNSDPIKSWENLRQVHIAHRFASRLALRRWFMTMKKEDSQSMQLWIASVKQISQCISHATNPLSSVIDNRLQNWLKAHKDEEVISVLMNGLDDSYDKFVISLDSIPLEQLTLNYVINCLLNEESRQLSPHPPPPHHSIYESQALATTCSHSAKCAINVTCFNCRGHGHYEVDCPSPPQGNSIGNLTTDSGNAAIEVIDHAMGAYSTVEFAF